MKNQLRSRDALNILPGELWARIAFWLPVSGYSSLNASSKSLSTLLGNPFIKRRWLLRLFDGNRSDALLFAYRYNLTDVMDVLLSSTGTNRSQSLLLQMSDAFTQIVCQEAAKEETKKLRVISKLLMEDRMWHLQERIQKIDTTETNGSDGCTVIQLDAQELAIMALRWCTYYAETSIVQFLLEDFGLKISAINCYCSWWIRLLKQQRFDMASLLLKHGAHVSSRRNAVGDMNQNSENPGSPESSWRNRNPIEGHDFTPLRVLASEGCLDAVKFLLENTPAYQQSLQTKNDARYTVLMTAAMNDQRQIVEFLLAESDYKIQLEDGEADTFLVAAGSNSEQVLEFLMEHCSKNLTNYPTEDHWEQSSKSAVEHGHIQALRVLLKHAYSQEHLNVLLQLACKCNHIDIVRLLLEHNADLSHQDFLCVKLAVQSGNFRVINTLILHAEDQSSLENNEHGTMTRKHGLNIVARCKEILTRTQMNCDDT